MDSPAFNFALDVIDKLAVEDRAGLIFIDEVGHRRDYTFEEISKQSQRYAAVLRAFGVGPGERVVLNGSNTAKFIFTMLALERLGAYGLSCAETATPAERVAAIEASGASTVIANRKYRAQIDGVREAIGGVKRFIIVGEEAEGWARVDSLTERAQPYAGAPTQSALGEAANDAPMRLALASTDRFWAAFPVGSDAWIANTFVGAWSCGAAMVVHEGAFDAVERLDLLRELEVTVLLQTAAEYQAEAAVENLAAVRLPRLRRALCAGDAPDPETGKRWIDAIHVPLERVSSGVRSLQRT